MKKYSIQVEVTSLYPSCVRLRSILGRGDNIVWLAVEVGSVDDGTALDKEPPSTT